MQLNVFLEACLYSPMHAQSEEQLSTEITRYTSQPQIYYQHLKISSVEGKKINPKFQKNTFLVINQLNFQYFI